MESTDHSAGLRADEDELENLAKRLAAIRAMEYQLGMRVLQCLDMIEEIAERYTTLPVPDSSNTGRQQHLEEALRRAEAILEPLSDAGMDLGRVPPEHIQNLGRRFSRDPATLSYTIRRIWEHPFCMVPMPSF